MHITPPPPSLSDTPPNTKHLHTICKKSAQRLRRWTNIVQMFQKCCVFTATCTTHLSVAHTTLSEALLRPLCCSQIHAN